MNTDETAIAAVVAAAGFSQRMGDFKQLLPWGEITVIEAAVTNLLEAGASPIICVVGHRGNEVAAILAYTAAQIVRNPDYAQVEMLRSYQAGIHALLSPATVDAEDHPPAGALLALGDQPHISVAVLRHIIESCKRTPEQILIPSYQMRRGHPVYLPRRLWPDLLALGPNQSLRDLLNAQSQAIAYIDVGTDAIRRDMDYWVEYQRLLQEYEK
ncbi:MAG: NTP transferase domain-containing protein [Caldilineaceae bacterium]|nr:NTP transferase domain-containing protein [Caldilineaceae bacterium]